MRPLTRCRYYTPEYLEARRKVFIRDKYQCKNCGEKGKSCRNRLQIHHIKKWADYPTLRYVTANMITLCKKCHQKLWAKEEEWESYCLRLINKENLQINYELWKARQEE